MQTLTEFEPRLGETFELAQGDEATVGLVLAEVKAIGQGTREGGSFSVVFEASKEIDLEQAIHRLRVGEAEFDIFLVPIGPFGDGMGFEAVFN